MNIDFSTAGRIIFGSGKLSMLSGIIGNFGERVLIVKGSKNPDPARLISICDSAGLRVSIFVVDHEPDIEMVNRAIQFARQEKCEFVIAFGGGSVIDAGKVVAALLSNDGSLLDYLEVVGKGKALENRSKPYIAIPTTAGTGSEVTRNAVISVKKERVKVSMRNAFLLPAISLVDPELTLGVPPEVTVVTGMYALTQVIEPYVTRFPNPMVDLFCKEGISRGSAFLYQAWVNGSDIEARENVSWMSLMGGLALANAKLGAVHGFAGPIGGMFNAPHGAICAALLPAVMLVNSEIIRKSSNETEKLERFQDISRWITGNDQATIKDGSDWISALCKKMKIPGLSSMGIKRSDFQLIIEKSGKSSSMKGNPVQLSQEDMARILELSL